MSSLSSSTGAGSGGGSGGLGGSGGSGGSGGGWGWLIGICIVIIIVLVVLNVTGVLHWFRKASTDSTDSSLPSPTAPSSTPSPTPTQPIPIPTSTLPSSYLPDRTFAPSPVPTTSVPTTLAPTTPASTSTAVYNQGARSLDDVKTLAAIAAVQNGVGEDVNDTRIFPSNVTDADLNWLIYNRWWLGTADRSVPFNLSKNYLFFSTAGTTVKMTLYDGSPTPKTATLMYWSNFLSIAPVDHDAYVAIFDQTKKGCTLTKVDSNNLVLSWMNDAQTGYVWQWFLRTDSNAGPPTLYPRSTPTFRPTTPPPQGLWDLVNSRRSVGSGMIVGNQMSWLQLPQVQWEPDLSNLLGQWDSTADISTRIFYSGNVLYASGGDGGPRQRLSYVVTPLPQVGKVQVTRPNTLYVYVDNNTMLEVQYSQFVIYQRHSGPAPSPIPTTVFLGGACENNTNCLSQLCDLSPGSSTYQKCILPRGQATAAPAPTSSTCSNGFGIVADARGGHTVCCPSGYVYILTDIQGDSFAVTDLSQVPAGSTAYCTGIAAGNNCIVDEQCASLSCQNGYCM